MKPAARSGFNVVVPARYASTRLPGKPLLDLGGEPMLMRTVSQVKRSGADQVIVATDDARIESACREAGINVMMTSADHVSGTDRMYEVVAACGWDDDTRVINVQGDEPFIPPDSITQVADLLDDGDASIATLATPIESEAALHDPIVVKVVRANNGCALYFSRAAIPWLREPGGEIPFQALRHIGIYGYRSGMLREFSEAGCCELEQHERLEQLRALWHGWPIAVGLAREVPVPGVDTAEDLAGARARFDNGLPLSPYTSSSEEE